MKRLTAILLTLMMLVGIVPLTANAATNEIPSTLKINASWWDKELITVTLARANYQLLAPSRPFAEAMEAELEWNEATQTVSFKKDGYTAELTIGADNGKSSGKEVALETAAQLIDGTSYVPAEFVGKALNFHVLRENYGKQIRLITKTSDTAPAFEGDLKPGTAELVSTYHRPVPTEFEKSNDPNDLYFYTDFTYTPEEELTAVKTLDTSNLPSGEVIYTNDDMIDSTPAGSRNEGWWKPVDIDDESVPFDRALQVACTYVPTNSVDYIVKPTKLIEEYVDPEDKYLVSFYIRLAGGGHVDTGGGKAFIHVEESYIPTWVKSVAETVEFNTEWKKVYALATGVENANHIGITVGFWQQIVEIGGFEVQKLARDADTSMFDDYNKQVDLMSPLLSKDAPWRQEALDRIEKVRKGDFKVKVVDKNGNPVEGADVKLDMFEHEFRWGAVLDTSFYAPEAAGTVKQYKDTLGVNFNAAGAGNATKLYAWEGNPTLAKRKFDDAKNLGVRYFRGHVLWMPDLNRDLGSRPYRFYGADQGNGMTWETFEDYVKNYFNKFMTIMDEITELEVANEMTNRVTWDNNFSYGAEYLDELFLWADEIRTKNGRDDLKLGYCDNQIGNEKYWAKLDRFQKKNLPYEMIVHQGHSADFAHDSNKNVRRISEYMKAWDRYVYEYEKSFSISEYSITADTQEYQADHTRDILIAAFSHPGCEAFNIFWYSDVWSGSSAPAGCAPLYDTSFKPKLGLNVWQDMLYNKWWTRDAHGTTGSDGEATVRGFYGDYDITVSIGGKTVKTDMAAFHRGYENEYIITLDEI